MVGCCIDNPSSSGGGGGGPSANATFITLTNDPSLTNNRTIAVAATPGLNLTDGGALGPLTIGFSAQSANTVLAGPTSGSAATPAFRALVAADIPNLNTTYIPYTGATADVDLGTHALTVDSINLSNAILGGIEWNNFSSSITSDGGGIYLTTIDASGGFYSFLNDGGGVTFSDGLHIFLASESVNPFVISSNDGSFTYFQIDTVGNVTLTDGASINLGTSNGTRIGTSTSQKLAFFNSTPIAKPTGNIATALSNLGLVGSPTVVATTNANLTGPITSVGNATSIASQTGTGTKFVVDTSPTLVTPTIGAAVGTSLTLSSPNTTSTDVPNLSNTATFTNKRITPRTVTSTANSATPTINTDSTDIFVITGQSAAITSFTTNLSGTPTNGQKLWVSITGTGSTSITWGSSFESSTITLPTATSSTARLDVGFIWNATTSKWRCVGVA
jgi:hypothetical protein